MTHLPNEEMDKGWYWGYHECLECGSDHCSWNKGGWFSRSVAVICENCGYQDNVPSMDYINPIEVEEPEEEQEDY